MLCLKNAEQYFNNSVTKGLQPFLTCPRAGFWAFLTGRKEEEEEEDHFYMNILTKVSTVPCQHTFKTRSMFSIRVACMCLQVWEICPQITLVPFHCHLPSPLGRTWAPSSVTIKPEENACLMYWFVREHTWTPARMASQRSALYFSAVYNIAVSCQGHYITPGISAPFWTGSHINVHHWGMTGACNCELSPFKGPVFEQTLDNTKCSNGRGGKILRCTPKNIVCGVVQQIIAVYRSDF